MYEMHLHLQLLADYVYNHWHSERCAVNFTLFSRFNHDSLRILQVNGVNPYGLVRPLVAYLGVFLFKNEFSFTYFLKNSFKFSFFES